MGWGWFDFNHATLNVDLMITFNPMVAFKHVTCHFDCPIIKICFDVFQLFIGRSKIKNPNSRKLCDFYY